MRTHGLFALSSRCDNRRWKRRICSSIVCKYVHNRVSQVLLGLGKGFFRNYVFHLWPVSNQNQNNTTAVIKETYCCNCLNWRWFRRAAVTEGRKSNTHAGSFRKMGKCRSVITSSVCVSTFVNQQRWDVRSCVCDGFQAPAEMQKREFLFFPENFFYWSVHCVCKRKGKETVSERFIWDHWPTTSKPSTITMATALCEQKVSWEGVRRRADTHWAAKPTFVRVDVY